MSQRTLVLLKPDTVRRGLVGEVLSRFEAKGLTIVAMDLRTIDGELADQHYAEHVEKAFYPPLRDFVTSGPRHHPRRPLAVQPREPRPRLRLRRIRRPGNQNLVPRPPLRYAGLRARWSSVGYWSDTMRARSAWVVRTRLARVVAL